MAWKGQLCQLPVKAELETVITARAPRKIKKNKREGKVQLSHNTELRKTSV